MEIPARGPLLWLLLAASLFSRCCGSTAGIGPSHSEEERRALLEIKQSINQPDGSALPDWGQAGEGEEDDCPRWDGVVCDSSTRRVVGIHLRTRRWWMGYENWYPNASLFAQLEELQELDLNGNWIGGWIMPQAFCKMKKLKRLDLGRNVLDRIEACFSRMHSLRYLDVSNNQIQGNFPPSVCSMHSLDHLDLSGNQLNGGFPSCFGRMSSLTYVDLSHNLFQGNFPPSVCSMHSLDHLDLSQNQLKGSFPSCLGRMSSLTYVDLSNNLFQGNFPLSVCSMHSLDHLDLSGNELNGSFPSCFGRMSSLTFLRLSHNKFQGNLPSCLCHMGSLSYLDVSFNQFSGNIPSCLYNLQSLEVLDLSNNTLNGSIHPSIFSNLTKITQIKLSHNGLEGRLPFATFANLSNLVDLDLSSNNGLEIETEFPTWFPSFQLTSLGLASCIINRQSGFRIPNFIPTQHRLSSLDLSNGSLSGTIPSWILYNNSLSELSSSGNNLTGLFPCPEYNFTSHIGRLDLSGNHIHGSLPSNIGSLFPLLLILKMARNCLQGQVPSSLGELPAFELLLEGNNFTGEIPPSLFNNSQLQYLVLSNNRLEGERLADYVHLPELQLLLLRNNHFTGFNSRGLSNSSRISALDVSHNYLLKGDVPSQLPTSLRVLALAGNQLGGHIPAQLCQMQRLRFLDLSNNDISGYIPSCLSNVTSWLHSDQQSLEVLTRIVFDFKLEVPFITKNQTLDYQGRPLDLMSGIDLSSNHLVGAIPSEFGELKALRSLNLSNNLFEGVVSPSFGHLENLESLDLSHNELNGTIPQELAQLTFLSFFSVAFNNLSGSIPSGRQFSLFPESSFWGNPGLCGPPLVRNCSADVLEQTRVVHPENEETGSSTAADNTLLFYSLAAIGFACGFWGILAFIFLSKDRRVKYLRAIDQFSDKYFNGF